MNRACVIGLDGATFTLLDPLMAEGKMPNLARLMKKGVRATLRSTKPPVTAPSWTTFATGVNPGKHGCYDFFIPGRTINDFKPVNSSCIKVPTFYEMLEDAGKKAVLINLPNTFPPKTKFPTITSLMTVGDEYIFPRSLKNTYPELAGYALAPDEAIKVRGDVDAYIRHILDIERKRVCAVKRMFVNEQWDFFFFLFSSVDWISHLVFHDMVTKRHPEAMKVFDLVDEFFGWLLENVPADVNIYVLSDHGFTYYTELFYINRWLEQEGYLRTSAQAGQLEENATVRRKKLAQARSKSQMRVMVNRRLLRILFIHPLIERWAKRFYKRVIKKFLPIHFDIQEGLDLAHTKVCFPRGSMLQTLYLNYAGNFETGLITDQGEYDGIRAEVKQKLEQLRSPSGRRVTEHVYTKEELYGKTPPIPSPDLHCQTKDIWIVGHLHSKSLFEDHISNKHDANGVFFAAGPDIQSGQSLGAADMTDICPTILHQLGMSIPRYSDGKVLPIFRPESAPASQQPSFTDHVISEKRILAHVLNDIKF